MKRIMSEKKTTWKTVKSETEKVNNLLKNIPTNNNMKLNDLINAGAKLVSEKIGSPQKTTDIKLQHGWELSLKSMTKRLWQQAKILKRNVKIYSDEAEKARQLERNVSSYL